MTSDEGQFFHKASLADGTACGIYIFSEPDQRIEVHFNYLDVPCENGGLVSVSFTNISIYDLFKLFFKTNSLLMDGN